MSCCFGEFLGTFALVSAGTGAVIANDVSGGVSCRLMRTVDWCTILDAGGDGCLDGV